jgi:hypothetical protein
MQAIQLLGTEGYKGNAFACDTACSAQSLPPGSRPGSALPKSKVGAFPARQATSPPSHKSPTKTKRAHRPASCTKANCDGALGHSERPAWWSSAQQSPLHVLNDQLLGPLNWLEEVEASVRSPEQLACSKPIQLVRRVQYPDLMTGGCEIDCSAYL